MVTDLQRKTMNITGDLKMPFNIKTFLRLACALFTLTFQRLILQRESTKLLFLIEKYPQADILM